MGFAQLGVLRTGKGIPEIEFPKSNLWGTTFTISAGSRYHLHYHLLNIYFRKHLSLFTK